ncbi:MAG TPA: hypothetical protein EYH39_03165 [Desulfurobacteriaceae bacterium]|nr:hypothetical protein [Desulfurobacteriaceae bacterium]
MFPLSNEDIKDLENMFLQKEKQISDRKLKEREKKDDKKITKKKKSIENKEDIAFLKNEIKKKDEKISKLNQKIFELTHEVEIQKKQILSPSRLELFLEIALNALSNFITEKENKKVLFSKNFRKSFIAFLAQKPFLFDSFIKSFSHLEENSKALSENIYILEVPSYYGEYAALFTYLEKDIIKFLRFGPKENIIENYEIIDVSL